MVRKNSNFTLFTLIAVLMLFASSTILFSCKDSSEKQEAQKEQPPIKIAVVGAHTGDLASYGIPTVKAAEIVAEKYNAMAGINGRKIELVVEDDACKPEMAVNSATKVTGEKVHAVLGHICSGATKAALGIYKDSSIVTISPSATNPELTYSGDYPNFFRAIAPDNAQAKLEVDFALDTLKLKKIAILHDKGDYGKGLAEFAKQFLEKDGRAQLVLYEGITPGAVDYSAVVNKIKQSGAEAVIFGGYHPEASKLIMQIRKKKMITIFISDDGVKDDTFIKVAKSYAEGVYATGPMDTSHNPIAIEAMKLHEEKYGEKPGAFFMNAYSAMLSLVNAFMKSDSTDYDTLVKTLQTEYVATPMGIIRFDEKGDATGIGFSVYQVKKGIFVEVK